MADVMTTIGLKDNDFTATLSRLENFAKSFKQRMEASPIELRTGGGKGASALNIADNPLFKSVMAQKDQVEKLQQMAADQGSGGGMGKNIAGQIGAMYNLGSATAKVGVEAMRYLEQMAKISTAHTRWQADVSAIVSDYGRVASQVGIVKDSVQAARDAQIEMSQAVQKNVGRMAAQEIERVGSVDNIASTTTARVLSKIPGIGRFFDYGDKSVSEQIADTQRTAEVQANRAAALGNRAADRAAEQARQAQQRQNEQDFIDKGRSMSAAQASQIEEQRRKDEQAARAGKDRQDATQQLKLDDLASQAQLKRLAGEEKEARLLETKAELLRKVYEIENNANLSNAQKHTATLKAYDVAEAQTRGIENDARISGRIQRSFDYSAGGGSGTLMAALGVGPAQRALEEIAKNTKGLADALGKLNPPKESLKAVWG